MHLRIAIDAYFHHALTTGACPYTVSLFFCRRSHAQDLSAPRRQTEGAAKGEPHPENCVVAGEVRMVARNRRWWTWGGLALALALAPVAARAQCYKFNGGCSTYPQQWFSRAAAR